MDKAALAAANIDYDEGLKRFSGYEALYVKYLKRFVEDDMEKLLNEQMSAEDYEKAYETAHKLKGIIGNLSINGLYRTVTRFCDCLKNGADIESAVQIYPDFVEEMAKAKAVIKAQL